MDSGYVNARIKGMGSRLLDKKSLESLILKPDVESLISDLAKTPYKSDIEEASVRLAGVACIEEALRKNLARTFRKMLQFIEGEPGEKYLMVFLRKWDVQNIRTILRGKNIHAPPDEIRECLVPAGSLDEATLIEVMKQPDVRGVIDQLATWENELAIPLTQSIEEYMEKRNLGVLEYALDRFYYANALNLVKGSSYEAQVIGRLIATEIDVTNIKSVLVCLRDQIEAEDAEKLLLDGGAHLNRDHLNRMINSGSISAAIKHLNGTPYHFLGKIPEDVIKAGRISAFEKELDRYLIRKGARLYRGDPLNIAIVIGFLWLKNSEVINIRIIARCKDAGVSEEELEEDLLYV
jgi:V/A-type H+-transporting ATPase subunit C